MNHSQRPHGLQPTRLLRPWDFPGKSTGVGCHCLLRSFLIGNSNSSELPRCLSGSIIISPFFERIVLLSIEFLNDIFFFLQRFKNVILPLLNLLVADVKLAVNLTEELFIHKLLLYCCFQDFLSLHFNNLIMFCLGVTLFEVILLGAH